MLISCGTVISSLFSEKIIYKFGTGMVSAVSTLLTAVALFGFSVSGNFYMLCFLAIPYGLGAGAIDAALNNYVALHFASRHMSWLHCFWGIGAAVGPYVMGAAMSLGKGWRGGYLAISVRTKEIKRNIQNKRCSFCFDSVLLLLRGRTDNGIMGIKLSCNKQRVKQSYSSKFCWIVLYWNYGWQIFEWLYSRQIWR